MQAYVRHFVSRAIDAYAIEEFGANLQGANIRLDSTRA
jgi:hypothetical protein